MTGDSWEQTVRQIILWGVAFAVLCSAISCRRRPPVSAPGTTETAKSRPTTAASISPGANLQVTALGAGYNEIAEVLGMQMWRFHIACDAPGVHLFHTISLRKSGQLVKEISGGLGRWSDAGDKQMIVALYPLEGDLNTRDKLKTYVRIGDTRFSAIRDNPLKGRHGTTTLSVARRQDDGSFLLMQSSGGGGDTVENTMQLVLRVYVSGIEGPPPPQ
jgi:hypothetical protein